MKISSASKKVLASALSAAMVVAFAPAAAFGAVQGNTVTVEFDVNGGAISSSAADGTQAVQASKTYDVSAGKTVTLDQTTIDQYVDANGYSFADWWYDADADGVIDNDETYTKDGSIDVSKVTAGSTIKLVAQYAVPTVAANTGFVSDVTTATESDQVIEFDVSAAGALDDTAYTVAVSGPEGEVYTQAVQGSSLKSISKVLVKFSSNADKATYSFYGNTATVTSNKKLATGKYSVTVKAGDKTVASAEAEVTEVSFSAAGNSANPGTYVSGTQYVTGQKVKALVGAKYSDVFSAIDNGFDIVPGKTDTAQDDEDTNEAVDNDGVGFAGYKLGDFELASYGEDFTVNKKDGKDVKVSAGDSLTAVYAYPRIGELYFPGYNALVLEAADLDTEHYTYAATVNGNAMAEQDDDGIYYVYSTGTAQLPAGEYTATLTATKKSDKSVSTVGTAKVTVVEVKYDLNGGTETSGAASAKTFGSFYASSDDKVTAQELIGVTSSNVTAPEGKKFKEWQIDGKKATANQTAFGTGANYVVTLTAAWEDANVAAAPTYSYASGALTFAQDNGSDYAIKVGTESASTAYSGGSVSVRADGTSVMYAATVVADGVKNPKLDVTDANIVVFGYAKSGIGTAYASVTPLNTYETFADSALSAKTAASTAAAPQYYSTVLTSAKKAGSDAVKATGYATEKDWKTTVTAQQRAVLEAVAGNAAETLTALKTATKSADGKTYSYVSDGDAATAQAAIDQVLADFDGLHGSKASTYTAKTSGLATGSEGVAYANAITAAVTGVHKTTVSATDYDAAAAVTTQLEAAKDATAAKAAIEAYQALTDTQKALVSAADVTAAQQIVADQEKKDAEQKLIDAQDEAAVAGITGKTVKAKSKKKVTAKLKGATSKSGNVVTFSKKSGNAKVKIAKGGKITVKKGLKKGKKYTVKVTASCGNATKVVKVVVKVVK